MIGPDHDTQDKWRKDEREAIGGDLAEENHNALYKKVLDKGFVRLVDFMGNDLSIVRAARVSYNAEPRHDDSDAKLIRYLWKHKHTTPFESCVLTFEVKAPIFVFRQWHRHRTQSYNEVSARYTELADEFYVPDPTIVGEQATKNKQGREIAEAGMPPSFERIREVDFYAVQCMKSFEHYKFLLDAGWPRELARMVLPLSTYSKMFTTMNLRNLFHFLELRLHEHAQYEIRVYAEAILELITPIFPIATSAFKENANK